MESVEFYIVRVEFYMYIYTVYMSRRDELAGDRAGTYKSASLRHCVCAKRIAWSVDRVCGDEVQRGAIICRCLTPIHTFPGLPDGLISPYIPCQCSAPSSPVLLRGPCRLSRRRLGDRQLCDAPTQACAVSSRCALQARTNHPPAQSHASVACTTRHKRAHPPASAQRCARSSARVLARPLQPAHSSAPALQRLL